MQFLNLVEKNGESPYLIKMHEYLDKFYDDDTVLIAKVWNQECSIDDNKKFIVIVTSAEGHRFIPDETYRLHPNCLGVFTHYYPKKVNIVEDQFDPNNFLKIKNLYQFQLGPCFFSETNYIPILERKYDVSFIGQLDPYVRMDFFSALNQHADSMDNTKFIFYEGWNNGLGKEKYKTIMEDTKIALVPYGSASLDTFRFYEACQAGCVILTLKQNNYEFMKDSPHIEIPSWKVFKQYVDILLQNPKKLTTLSKQTIDFWNNSLSPEAAAKFILKKLGVTNE